MKGSGIISILKVILIYVKSDQQSESAETDSNIGSVYKGPHENFKDIDDLINKQGKEREDDRFKEMQR